MNRLISTLLAIGAIATSPIKVKEVEKVEPIEYINFSVGNNLKKNTDVIVRCGEWFNKETNEIKPGKRVYIENINYLNIPDDIPIRYDKDGYYIHEFDINKKLSTKVYEKLKEKGINTKLQISSSGSEDLNAAGRIANESDPKVYLSIHTNAHDNPDTEGYFFMYNTDDYESEKVADRLSKSIEDNGLVVKTSNRTNTGYIGELNSIDDDTIAVLGELGFYTSLDELENIISDEYVEFVSQQIANELYEVLEGVK